MNLNSFTYQTYIKLLTKILETHHIHPLSDFWEEGSLDPVRDENIVLLRHDVDICPLQAMKMAEIESDRGVRASYHFLVGHYNLFKPERRLALEKICSLGHDVGLHYDLSQWQDTPPERYLQKLMQEVEIIKIVSGAPRVLSVSMHSPSIFGEDTLLGKIPPPLVHAMSPQFIRGGYFSDSAGGWRNNAFEVLSGDLPPQFQLLVHPFFWGRKHQDRWNRLSTTFDRKHKELKQYKGFFTDAWQEHQGRREHDLRQANR